MVVWISYWKNILRNWGIILGGVVFIVKGNIFGCWKNEFFRLGGGNLGDIYSICIYIFEYFL